VKCKRPIEISQLDIAYLGFFLGLRVNGWYGFAWSGLDSSEFETAMAN